MQVLRRVEPPLPLGHDRFPDTAAFNWNIRFGRLTQQGHISLPLCSLQLGGAMNPSCAEVPENNLQSNVRLARQAFSRSSETGTANMQLAQNQTLRPQRETTPSRATLQCFSVFVFVLRNSRFGGSGFLKQECGFVRHNTNAKGAGALRREPSNSQGLVIPPSSACPSTA